MKKISKILLGMGVLATVLSGCSANNSSQSSVLGTAPDVEVWGAYSTAKVIQDPDYNVNHKKLAAAIDVASCLGEEEDGQLIITANERVDWYSLQTSELKTADGDVFSTDNIWVYNQFYHEIYLKSQGRVQNEEFYPLGFTPDALAPQAGSERNKENFIEAGKNQGITVTFNVPTDQKPGVYTGEFTLIIDGYKKSVPVRLTVWNIDNTYTHGHTWVDTWSPSSNGSLDSINYSGVQRGIMESEYNYWVSKRINPMRIPYFLDGPEGWAEGVVKLWDNPRFNSFVFDDMQGDKDRIKRYVTALVNVADRDQINYVEAAAFYEKECDEPPPGSERMRLCELWLNNTMEALEEIATAVENDETMFSENAQLKAEVCASIRGIPFLITAPYENLTDNILATTNGICPQFDAYSSPERRAWYEAQKEEGNFTTGWYTAMFPTYPMPSHAIDDYSLGLRVSGWMRKDFNIDGYLNWDGNMQGWSGNPFYSGNDQYEDVLRLYLVGSAMFLNGDGFFTYPGQRYDLETPVGSIRMNALRDMQEDYDMITVFEEQYDALVKKYGANKDTFNPDLLLKTLYDSLYEDLIYYTEEELVLEAREKLASWMEGMQESSLLFNYEKKGENVIVSLYSDADELYINGLKTTGTGAKYGKFYQRMLALEDGETQISVRAVKDGKSYTYVYGVGSKNYTALQANTLTAEMVTLSKGSSYDAQTGVFTMKSGGDSYADQLTFRVQAKVPFRQSIAKDSMDSLYLDFFNENDFDVKVRFGYYSGTSMFMVQDYIVKAGEMLTFTDLRVNKTDKWNKSSIDGFVLVFDNMNDKQVLYPDRKFRIGDVVYTKPKGGN